MAYISGTLYNLIRYGGEITFIGFIDAFKLVAFIFVSIVVPAVILGAYLGIMKIKAWIGDGR